MGQRGLRTTWRMPRPTQRQLNPRTQIVRNLGGSWVLYLLTKYSNYLKRSRRLSLNRYKLRELQYSYYTTHGSKALRPRKLISSHLTVDTCILQQQQLEYRASTSTSQTPNNTAHSLLVLRSPKHIAVVLVIFTFVPIAQ